ncbi:Hypothetical predicted protein [Pelobates cultripes]|uniref:Uncharacterized protein n=1 Tax=Pelobates cultripes TaxID=61616 RepID=A0AAD1S8V8_PELCU|nr:Hypothetical predicted protein [Pelobates cultripes]
MTKANPNPQLDQEICKSTVKGSKGRSTKPEVTQKQKAGKASPVPQPPQLHTPLNPHIQNKWSKRIETTQSKEQPDGKIIESTRRNTSTLDKPITYKPAHRSPRSQPSSTHRRHNSLIGLYLYALFALSGIVHIFRR